MIDPGRLNRRVTLEAPTETDDGQGGVVRGFAVEAALWAQIEPLATREGADAGAEVALRRVRITLRRGVALSRRHRLRDGETLYRILGWRERDAGALIEIDAETPQA